MKLGRIVVDGPDGRAPRLVGVDPDRAVVVDLAVAERLRLERAGASPDAARRIAHALFPPSMADAIAAGPAFVAAAARAMGDGGADATVPWRDVEWATPVDPPVVMDCSAFEEHMVNAYGRGDQPVPEYFYEAPIYYKMNPLTLFGHEADVPYPAGARFLDYELELAVVIGRQGADLRPDEARGHVFGVTIMNDFSARDLQMREMTASLGPAKGKDFATSIGPWITTMDELDADRLEMVARVNGEEWTRNSMATITWTIDELVAYVSRAETLGPRQVIATDTVGRGSGLELYRKLRPGDVVELDIDGIGTLRNRLAHSVGDRWAPEPKVPRGLTPYRP